MKPLEEKKDLGAQENIDASISFQNSQKIRFAVILVKPEKPENIGLVARCMKNTGFEKLRLVKEGGLKHKSLVTAVHSKEILERAQFHSTLSEATNDLNVIFAATSKKRKNFTTFFLDEALNRILSYPQETKIGLLFGNERTGLTSEELRSSNFCFTIPQASKQPSYNLASAVCITLFQISIRLARRIEEGDREKALSRKEQEEFIQLLLRKLEKINFIHSTNRQHVTEMIYDLFGRLAMTPKDKKLLLALFSKGIK